MFIKRQKNTQNFFFLDPQTIAALKTNYKIQANKDSVAICGKCLLCNRGEDDGNSIKKTYLIISKSGKINKL